MNTSRVVSRMSVMLGIDGLHGGRPEIGLVSGRTLDTCSTNSEEKGRIRFVVGQSSS